MKIHSNLKVLNTVFLICKLDLPYYLLLSSGNRSSFTGHQNRSKVSTLSIFSLTFLDRKRAWPHSSVSLTFLCRSTCIFQLLCNWECLMFKVHVNVSLPKSHYCIIIISYIILHENKILISGVFSQQWTFSHVRRKTQTSCRDFPVSLLQFRFDKSTKYWNSLLFNSTDLSINNNTEQLSTMLC